MTQQAKRIALRMLALASASAAIATPAIANDEVAALTAAPADRSAQPDQQGPRIEISAIQGDTRASLKLQGGSSKDNLATDNGTLKTRDTQWQITFSAPLNEDGDFTDLATLDNLASGFKLEFGGAIRLGTFKARSSDELNERTAIARRLCNIKANGDPARVAACASRPADDELFEEFGVVPNIHHGTTKLGFAAALGYDKFKYRDPSTLIESSVDKVGYSATAYLSHLFPSGATSVGAQIKYEVGYEAADKQILCPANPGNVVITCFNASYAPPSKDKSLLASFDLRQYLGEGLGFPIAIAPLVTYDISDDVLGIDVPLYLVSDGKLGLTGGVRVGWRSDNDDVIAGIFIGKTFGHTTND